MAISEKSDGRWGQNTDSTTNVVTEPLRRRPQHGGKNLRQHCSEDAEITMTKESY
jgi:hypothetical protein